MLEKMSKPRVRGARFEIRIASSRLSTTDTPDSSDLCNAEKSRLYHAQHRITTCEVVPCDRIIGNQPRLAAIDLEGTPILALWQRVVPMNAQSIDVERVSFQNPSQKIDLKVDLALLTCNRRVEVSGESGVLKRNRQDDLEVRPSQRAPSRPVIQSG